MTRLHLDEPIDLGLSLKSGQVFGWSQTDDGWCRGVHAGFHMGLRSEGVDLEVDAAAEAIPVVRALLGLDICLEEGRRALLEADPGLAPYLATCEGLRLLQPRDLTEVLFSFLCTPCNNLPRIESLVRKLRSFGEPISGGERDFPRVERIAALDENTLRALGFGYRGATIPAVARTLFEWVDWEARLRADDYQTSRSRLTALPGVGSKLADCICLYGLGHLEAVPVDTHLWQAAAPRYAPQRRAIQKPTDTQKEQVGAAMRERFGKWAGYAQLALFYGHMRGVR